MPTNIPLVFAPEDEKNFLGFLAPLDLECYPARIPPGFKPFMASPENLGRLEVEAYYLAAPRFAPVNVHAIKKGRDKGFLEIAETDSPVIHYERCLFDEQGQLRSGRLWTAVDLTGDADRNPAFPDGFRRLFMKIREHLVAQCRRSDPAGFLVAPAAARLFKAGTVLRESGRKGGLLKPYG
jgi:hypothetical protein